MLLDAARRLTAFDVASNFGPPGHSVEILAATDGLVASCLSVSLAAVWRRVGRLARWRAKNNDIYAPATRRTPQLTRMAQKNLEKRMELNGLGIVFRRGSGMPP